MVWLDLSGKRVNDPMVRAIASRMADVSTIAGRRRRRLG